MARLIPRLGADDSAIQKMCSGESWLSMLQFFFQSVASEYCPELITLSAAAIASVQRAVPCVKELAVRVPLKPCALRYRLARIASAEPGVTRPRNDAGQVAGSTGRAALS